MRIINTETQEISNLTIEDMKQKILDDLNTWSPCQLMLELKDRIRRELDNLNTPEVEEEFFMYLSDQFEEVQHECTFGKCDSEGVCKKLDMCHYQHHKNQQRV